MDDCTMGFSPSFGVSQTWPPEDGSISSECRMVANFVNISQVHVKPNAYNTCIRTIGLLLKCRHWPRCSFALCIQCMCCISPRYSMGFSHSFGFSPTWPPRGSGSIRSKRRRIANFVTSSLVNATIGRAVALLLMHRKDYDYAVFHRDKHPSAWMNAL